MTAEVMGFFYAKKPLLVVNNDYNSLLWQYIPNARFTLEMNMKAGSFLPLP